jgi:hypothetical protein
MTRSILPLAILVSLSPVAARAQVGIRIDIGLPPAPPLVVVQPGIQVVEGFREEVFFHRGWYWCRRPDGWYRARSPRDRFDWIEGRRVPGVLVRMPAGRYRDWHHEGRYDEGRRGGPERREDRREHRDPGRGRDMRDHNRDGEDRGHHER